MTTSVEEQRITSVKKLLREEGVRKRLGYDPKPYVTGAHC